MRVFVPLFLVLAFASPVGAEPFVFRGQLHDRGEPADGTHALRLTLYAHEHASLPLAGPLDIDDVAVRDGRFAVDLELPPLPPALDAGWLEVQVRASEADGAFVAVGGRERVALKAAQVCPPAWALGGNADTDAAVDFLGTTTAQPLVLRGNNLRIGSFEAIALPAGHTANVVLGAAANTVEPGMRGVSIGGGGSGNDADPDFADTGPHNASAHYVTIAGGNKNRAGVTPGFGDFASVGGGRENVALGTASVVGGGDENLAFGPYTTVSGGILNDAQSVYTTIGGGSSNLARGGYSTVAGGRYNDVVGEHGSVPGGEFNCAGGVSSFAAGHRAKVRPPLATTDLDASCDDFGNSGDADGDEGSFVWADRQQADFISSGPNQFAIRASGGVRLANDTSQFFGDDARQMLNLFEQSYGIGVQSGTLYFRTNARFAWFDGGVHDDVALEPGSGGALLMTLGTTSGTPTGVARAQTFTSVSSRHVKRDFAAVDAGAILARVLALPLSEWSYANAPEVRHIGPMSQDFHAAFGLNGADDEAIATVDADGVALAAIQGLNAKLEALQAEHDALRAELAALRARSAEAR